MDRSRFHFLFRNDAGEIDRATWWRGAVGLAVVWAFATYIIFSDGFQKLPIEAFLSFYFVLPLGIALTLSSWINLSAKRFRARGFRSSVGAAGLIPLLQFVGADMFWIKTIHPEFISEWSILAFMAVFLTALLWTIYQLGFAPNAKDSRIVNERQ